MTSRRTNALLIAGSGLWCLAIFAAPFSGNSRIVYEFFARICHQLPDRSWWLGGTPLPVCIRCTSIYTGFFVSCVFRFRASRRWLQIAIVSSALEFLLALTLIDSVALRAATGFLFGATVAPFVEIGIEEMMQRRRSLGVSR